eukprot:CAMPEP_0204897588 /NCGR_PEP_ID=MMETSP1397-20131031/821_1 /ASSEMBLY_ACC=CAM_ASM_000891 /TAXON_ID=49980 /ORGANISM="Climacostomum Climacostomum virens, Strain Stock W-24" /LENGTH=719 /DNA_ID=CAMNT_0052065359 /DNA_START=802 /DNA_END=2961 /DNA_ORIENTATION=+
MSSVFKRIGAAPVRYSVTLTVHQVKLSLSIPVRITVLWKRRNKRIETAQPASLQDGLANIEQSLTMINTLYLKKGGCVPKKAVLTLKAEVEGHGTKRVGKLELNISDYRETGIQFKEFALQSSFDRNAKIVLSIQSVEIGVPSATDAMSDVSGGSGISMGTDETYTGPPLSGDMGIEEEKRVIPGKSGRPPAVVSVTKFDLSPKRVVEKGENDVLRHRILELEEIMKENELKQQTFKDNCTDQLEILEREIQESEEDRSRLIGENNSLKRQVDKLKGQIEALRRELEKVEISKASAKSEESEGIEEALQNELHALAALSDRLQKDKITAEKECSKLQAQLSTSRVNYELAQHTIKRLREEIASGRIVSEDDDPLTIYKRQTDTIISHLKSQLREAEQFRAEALKTQEELTMELTNRESSLKIQQTDESAATRNLRKELGLMKRQLDLAKQAQAKTEKQLAATSDEYKEKLKDALDKLKALEDEFVASNFEVKKLERASRVSIIQEGLSNYQEAADKLKLAETKIAQLTLELHSAKQGNSETLLNKLKIAQDRLENAEYAASVEKAQHLERISQLEKEQESQEKVILRLKRELSDQNALKPSDESLSQSLTLCRLEVEDLKLELDQRKEELSKAESRVLELKMQVANIELERDTISQKCKDAQERLRLFSTQFTTIEVELYKANERYCSAINTNNELEFEMQTLRKQLEQATSPKKRGKR